MRLAAIIALASLSQAQDWPRFRGPNGSGVLETPGLPVSFGPGKNLVWATAVPFSRSSPVIGGSRVFLTAAEGAKRLTLCLDRDSGKELWRREIVPPRQAEISKQNDAASPSPVTDGRNVYAFFPDFGLVSYGPDGTERWRLPLGPFRSYYGLAASPILAGDTLVLVCDGRGKPFLVAVDIRSGKRRWRVERSEIRFEGYATPVLLGSAEVAVLGANRIDAYAVATGKRRWWLGGLAYFPVASPVMDGGQLLATTYGMDEPQGPSFADFLKEMDKDKDGRLSKAETRSNEMFEEGFGALDLNEDGYVEAAENDALQKGALGKYGLIGVRAGTKGEGEILWQNKKTWSSVSSALVYRDIIYLAKGAGVLAAIDPKSGAEIKIERAKEALGEYFASPVAGDGKVYFASVEGKVTVLRAGREWQILATNDLGEECYATPALSAGRLFVRTRNRLWSFGAK